MGIKIIADKTPIDELLEEQQFLRTPVTLFSEFKDAGKTPDLEEVYKDLIPLSKPGPGEQYAFQVELDSCTGCKACVTACHSLNGLEKHETWRDVGLIHTHSHEPFQQTVTTACHHCVDPACLHGCPVLAYEKNPVTGIVTHLDDQCIGCQYCVLKCPYDVPKYSEFLGIVRKCDMCHGRLQESEAPACVQACPTSAISIAIVDTGEVRHRAETGEFLPGAPLPDYTVPTTRYLSRNPIPVDAIAADFADLRPEHAHLPLVFMLVFTQLAAGCLLFSGIFPYGHGKALETGGFVALALGIFSSVLHLGRPLGAWRSFLGLRRSWLSREIVVFGMLLAASALYLVADRFSVPVLAGLLKPSVACLAGIGVFCSIMIYVDTRRPFWSLCWSCNRFVGTLLVMGVASGFLIEESRNWVGILLIVLVLAKLALECVQLLSGFRSLNTPARKSARLMMVPLAGKTKFRFITGLSGGVLIPFLILTDNLGAELAQSLSVLSWFLLLVGELFERTLFFQAVAAPKMPGGFVR